MLPLLLHKLIKNIQKTTKKNEWIDPFVEIENKNVAVDNPSQAFGNHIESEKEFDSLEALSKIGNDEENNDGDRFSIVMVNDS